MPSQEDVDEINSYLQQQAQRQAERPPAKKGILSGLQNALFGETHADYPPAGVNQLPAQSPAQQLNQRAASLPSMPAPKPASTTRIAEKNSFVVEAPATSPSASVPSSPTYSPAVRLAPNSKEEKKTMPMIVSSAPAPIANVSPAGIVDRNSMGPKPGSVSPKISSPQVPSAMSNITYKTAESDMSASRNPTPARFNPYPNPYQKLSPSPEKFSDTTAPPWVMRSLPAQSREKQTRTESAPVTSNTVVAPIPPAETRLPISRIAPMVNPKKESNVSSNPSRNTSAPSSTKAKLMNLIDETAKKEGNDSGQHMPWHEPASKEISPNELVGFTPTPKPLAVARAPFPSPTPTVSPSDVLSEHEHDYLVQKEKEYDSKPDTGGVTNFIPPRAASAGESNSTITNNSTIDEKKAILGRLKQLMAEHSTPTA